MDRHRYHDEGQGDHSIMNGLRRTALGCREFGEILGMTGVPEIPGAIEKTLLAIGLVTTAAPPVRR